MAPTESPSAPFKSGAVSQNRVMPEDIQAQAGIPLGRLLLYVEQVRFTAANQMKAIRHNLGVVPLVVLPLAEDPGVSTAIFWLGRPSSAEFVYLKCNVANTLCNVTVMG